MNRDGHRFYPLGLNCVHCHRWHPLEEAVAHIEQLHEECLSCQAERLLCKALIEDVDVGVQVWLDGERVR